ncbi:DNA repair protein XRCC2 [Monocercomonoides exilis]|uniref:DNA repair protein XRCC2 n=1 Tax=Monocercomonoides exilis TaxID=2049356 RepID=UPI003559542D|nr:DNA repair protein XRCC2 [Monocercomonoides exilis]|eukprot:MONOS_14472.1-p1 / transcript=MONOS_14472.1 / gene=MONOS_14472 / organism=Monocercomonoides_exilis_PA203 / gene_product=DNA repair protein XRCC2, putative / transcript_product=DNA repair protein XRCC2, putative / location=Mono_scaffold01007:18761-20644(+) / protein_length=527 / sequence_SO=supercontig / SO=protein_coding / is_pseudo=false
MTFWDKNLSSLTDEIKKKFDSNFPRLIPHETGIEIFEQIQQQKPLITGAKIIDDELPHGLDNGQIIEIRGGEGSGKSEILMSIAMNIIVPKTLGGCDSAVIFLDCDGKFSMSRFSLLLKIRLFPQCNFGDQLSEEQQILLDSAIKKLILIQPNSALSLLATIRIVLPKLLEKDGEFAARALFIDSISSTLWIDPLSSVSLQCGILSMECLIELIKGSNVVCFGTRLKFKGPTKAHESWEKNVSFRITLTEPEWKKHQLNCSSSLTSAYAQCNVISQSNFLRSSLFSTESNLSQPSSRSPQSSSCSAYSSSSSSSSSILPSSHSISSDLVFSAELLVLSAGRSSFLLSGGAASIAVTSAHHQLHPASSSSFSSSPSQLLSSSSSSSSLPYAATQPTQQVLFSSQQQLKQQQQQYQSSFGAFSQDGGNGQQGQGMQLGQSPDLSLVSSSSSSSSSSGCTVLSPQRIKSTYSTSVLSQVSAQMQSPLQSQTQTQTLSSTNTSSLPILNRRPLSLPIAYFIIRDGGVLWL